MRMIERNDGKENIQMIDGNKLAGVGFAYLGVSYSKMDCQAFVEQCLRDCGLNKWTVRRLWNAA